MNNQEKCADEIKETKVLPHKTVNLIKEKELEKEILIDEICESLTEEKLKEKK